MNVADRTRNIIAMPTTEWPVIAVEETTVSALYRRYILPFAAIPVIASLIGRMAFGDHVAGVGTRFSTFPPKPFYGD